MIDYLWFVLRCILYVFSEGGGSVASGGLLNEKEQNFAIYGMIGMIIYVIADLVFFFTVFRKQNLTHQIAGILSTLVACMIVLLYFLVVYWICVCT